MPTPARHAIATTLAALLVLLLLHGPRTATDMDGLGLPPVLSGMLRIASSLSPERIQKAMHASTTWLATFDRHIGGSGQAGEEGQDAMPLPDTAVAPDPSGESASAVAAVPLAPSHGPLSLAACHGAPPAAAPAPAPAAPPVAPPAPDTAAPDTASSGQTTASPAQQAATKSDGKGKSGKSIFNKPLSRRYKVLLVGDSFMEDIVLALMRNFHYRDPNVQYINVARHSTGLCVSTKWDWPAKMQGFMREYRPDVVLVFIGANDLQNIFDGKHRYSFTSPEWQKKYVEIATRFIDIASTGNARVIWIGMPVMGKEQYAAWMPLVARMQRDACAARNVTYIDTNPLLADANGQFRMYGQDASGKPLRLRKDDRYHVAYDGSMMIFNHLLPTLKQAILDKENSHALSLSQNPQPR